MQTDKYTVIIQARMGSSRRPGKINYLFDNEPMLMYQINRLKKFGLKNIIVATSNNNSDDLTELIAKKSNVKCFRGSENNVLKRFYQCALKYKINTIIRVGGDDPLVDPMGIKELLNTHSNNQKTDLVYSSHSKGWIYGTAAELFTFDTLKKAHKLSINNFDKEHIIPYLKKNKTIKKEKIYTKSLYNREDIYLSVDYQEDLDLIEQIIYYFTKKNKRYSFTQKELIKLYDSDYLNINNRHLHSGF
jgi:spore coat polysaccharide biosynthesis protein SpsF